MGPSITSLCSSTPSVMLLAAAPRASKPFACGCSVRNQCGHLVGSSSRTCMCLGSLVRCKLGRAPCKIRLSEASAVVEPVERDRRNVTTSAVLTSNMEADEEVGHCRCFLRARNGGDLLSCIRNKIKAGKLPLDIATRLEELYYNYQTAVMQSGEPFASEIILSNMAVVFDRILLDVEDPFSFSPYHKAVREPFDYYLFGQNYFHPLVDFRTSYIGNLSLFFDMEEKLKQGHNIILFCNHQTEGDPALIALLLERTSLRLAEKMVFVAGDRVVTDPLCKPFSMGRNLICVYSKKHMHDIPELVEMKRRANTRSLKEMAFLLRYPNRRNRRIGRDWRSRFPEPTPSPTMDSTEDCCRCNTTQSTLTNHRESASSSQTGFARTQTGPTLASVRSSRRPAIINGCPHDVARRRRKGPNRSFIRTPAKRNVRPNKSRVESLARTRWQRQADGMIRSCSCPRGRDPSTGKRAGGSPFLTRR